MNILHTLTVHSDRATGLLDVILAASADHIYLFDDQGCFLYVSPSACRALNRNASDFMGRYWSEIGLPAEAMVPLGQNREHVMSTGESVTAEMMLPLTHKNAYFEYVLTPVRDESGGVEMVVCNAWDITERRLAEQALRESEECFRLLVEGAANHALFTLDLAGCIATWNAGARRLKGYREDEIIGEHFSRFYPDEDRARGKPEGALRTAVQQGRYEEVGWRVRKDGTRFWADVVITPLYDEAGNLKGFSKITRDASDRRELEQRLNDQFALLQGIIDNTPSMIFITDLQDRYLLVNQSILKELSLGPGVATEEAAARFFGPGLHEHLRASARQVAAAGQGHEFEITVRQAQQSKSFIVNQFPIRGHGGRIWAVCSLATDITLRKQAEEEVKALNRTLEESVAKQRSINEELEAFSYSVSHDLRTPLRAIDGFSRLVLDEYQQELDDTGRDYLDRLRKASQRMGQLIDDLLMLSRISRADLSCAHLDISAMAREVAADMHVRNSRRSVDVRIADGMTSYGDRRLIKIVLENLVGNALKFTAPCTAPWIEVTQVQREEEIVFCVRDNGIGFDMAHAWQLFKPFRRLCSDIDFEGSGIGLATVERIVLRHQGRVWADSTPGNGAVFFFTLAMGGGS